MSQHSLAEARDNLSDLIDRALAGEGVVITRDGTPVAELRPVGQPTQRPARLMTDADVEWLRANRVGRKTPHPDAATLVRQMRDEGY